ncbi:MAG: transcriptional regulator [Desulfomicrobiaceae bacterium]|jgi:CRP/FNR family transcriptional regulator|nr:transcriptional regulator [Desulfomicrobiaceae bacterium]
MECLQVVTASSLFQGLPEAQELAAVGQVQRYTRGEWLFAEGDPAEGFFVVGRGRVRVFKTAWDGREQTLHILGPGEPVGEVPVFAGVHFPASAQALEDAEMCFFPRASLLAAYARNPALPMAMLAVLARRLREFTGLIESLSLKEMPQRLAAYLVHRAERGRRAVRLDVAKGTLATILGASPETLSRTLGRLAEAGVISVHGRTITLHDTERLLRLAQGVEKLG